MDGYKNNTTYIFIPFRFDEPYTFYKLIETIEKNENWEKVNDEILYMLKYVADKIDSSDKKKCQYFHSMVKDSARDRLMIASPDYWYSTKPRKYNKENIEFRFQLRSIQLYCFSTTVCIIAFQLHFENNDPLWVSSALFSLKRVSERIIKNYNLGNCADQMDHISFLDIAKSLMKQAVPSYVFEFFFYAAPSTERSNILTCLEVEEKGDYKRELYYLRRCYDDSYLYTLDNALDEQEIYAPSQDIIWGISPEASVCLTCPSEESEDFFHDVFYKNFNSQYLLMYVLLLHQKYVLYMMLTMVGVRTYTDLKTLEAYREQLITFEINFMFSCITEVPQYQIPYERTCQAFSLQRLIEDVREPLLSMSEVRKSDDDNNQKRREDSVDRALFLLALLGLFSALIDSFDFAKSFFGWFLGGIGIKVVQVLCIAAIFVCLAFVIKNTQSSKKGEPKNDNKKNRRTD